MCSQADKRRIEAQATLCTEGYDAYRSNSESGYDEGSLREVAGSDQPVDLVLTSEGSLRLALDWTV